MWIHPSRLPLGAGWEGNCTAPSGEGTIVRGDQLAHCNLGYASGCPRLPKERKWDAIRFAVTSEHEFRICLAYVCEKNHLPSEHGRLEYSVAQGHWLSSHADLRVQRMAECFLESWLVKARRAGDGDATRENNPKTGSVHERS